MNNCFKNIFKFMAWLFSEIIRLTQEGTIEEAKLLEDKLITTQQLYEEHRKELKKTHKIL